jgi:hypothetical protein
MAEAVKKKLVVCGGNGFLGMMAFDNCLYLGINILLGSRICKSAVSRGWHVVSIRYITSLAKRTINY